MSTDARSIIVSAEYFLQRIRSFLKSELVRTGGIVMIPQEGPDAGLVSSCIIDDDVDNSTSLNSYIAEIICKKFDEGNASTTKEAIEELYSDFVLISAPTDRFKTEVLFIWVQLNDLSTITQESLDAFSQTIELELENSKKSRFHDILITAISGIYMDGIFNSIIESIKSGLFCENVSIWIKGGSFVRCVNNTSAGLDFPIERSRVGEVMISGEEIIIQNVHDKEIEGSISNIKWLTENNLNSCILLPLSGVGETIGVVGVFFKRKCGVTQVDLSLAKYVVKYFERLWLFKVERDSIFHKTKLYDEMEAFYDDAIKCLSALHDLPSIHVGAVGALNSAIILSNSNERIKKYLDELQNSLDEIGLLVSPHARTLRLARTHQQKLTEADSILLKKRFNLRLLLDSAIEIGRKQASKYNITISLQPSEIPQYLYLSKEDFDKVIRNLISNAIKSLQLKSYIKREIRISVSLGPTSHDMWDVDVIIRVWDNGAGIEPSIRQKIFDYGYTTYRESGGRGIGLAVVREIAQKYLGEPNAISVWGEFAEFSVKLGANLR